MTRIFSTLLSVGFALGVIQIDEHLANLRAMAIVPQGIASPTFSGLDSTPAPPPSGASTSVSIKERACKPGVEDRFDNCDVYAQRNDWISLLADVDSSVRRIILAIIVQESAVSCSAVNPHSGALGLGQVMPFNLPSWMSAAGITLEPDLESQFLNSCEIQVKTIIHRMSLYRIWAEEAYDGGFRISGEPDRERVIIRYMASTWYSGDGTLAGNTRPQPYNGHVYPSIAEYTMSVEAHWDEISANERHYVSSLPEATDFRPVLSTRILDTLRRSI